MIFDTPSKSSNQNSSLQKSPHHKSTSALNDVTASTSAQPPTHTPVTATQSHAPHKQSVSSAYSDRSLANTDSPNYLANLTSGFADEFDSSPTSSVVSSQSNIFPKQANRHSNQGLREFDLTEDFLQHFSMRDPGSGRGSNHAPYEAGIVRNSSTPKFNSPVKPGGVDIPVTSSPVTRYKRSSSPNLVYLGDKGHHRSSSPLGEYEQQHAVLSSSYHPPSHLHHPPQGHQPHTSHRPQNEGALYSNPPHNQPGTRPPQRPGAGGGGNMLYDNEAAAKREKPSKIPVPTGQRAPSNSSESYDLHEMLQVWEKSNKNPFGEGTLV